MGNSHTWSEFDPCLEEGVQRGCLLHQIDALQIYIQYKLWRQLRGILQVSPTTVYEDHVSFSQGITRAQATNEVYLKRTITIPFLFVLLHMLTLQCLRQ